MCYAGGDASFASQRSGVRLAQGLAQQASSSRIACGAWSFTLHHRNRLDELVRTCSLQLRRDTPQNSEQPRPQRHGGKREYLRSTW